ncbi:endonuclease VIII [Rathayibacter rathayi]|uniref:Endonuclease VIII n=1 Tax=Rathayibacter rathayi TaxID=33887 RepID=A0ABD6W945_RATRA|nr:DNA-formamidopyrimidine glycosylase family protein [Rathayibacter rathayi]AZZ48647.1 endonuclease VIII [Rathayibacter rathayi]MWV74978.1 Fpg/Nei family DNA glycosylase [Rathayibacter rathayi NCPPB 2980 = VKM Ac-1601]PPF14466.1 endonuclease VIII [Rathayibacter rathayi]PPF43987.1 endonuclease VIII [Rathayibacter rathayi]PPF77019.1 endonuclease VIII [Rathayibacter rathayi]
MPELPEVQALALDLNARLGGRVLERLDVFAVSALKTVAISPSALAGEVVHAVTRHGKFLDLAVGDAHVLLHLARAGWVRWRPERPTAPVKPGRGPLAARLILADGSGFDVTEAGTKKSLALSIVADPLDVPGVARLGPDPLDPAFTKEIFGAILATAGRAQLKGVLRDQSRIAGIGNAYSDEILHVARMSPFKPAALTGDELDRLYSALRYTLEEALARAEGLHAADLKREKKLGMRVHGRTGEACPVCGDTVRQVIFHDSTLQYCPTCQTGGKVLADRVLSRLLR